MGGNYVRFVNPQCYGSGSSLSSAADYHLQSSSPAATLACDWVVPFDLDGAPRNSGGAAGAYEFSTSSTSGMDVVRLGEASSGAVADFNSSAAPTGAGAGIASKAAKASLIRPSTAQPIRLEALSLTADGLRLRLTAPSGTQSQLQASDDLRSWTTLATLSNSQGTVDYLDPMATALPHRFYRVLLP